LEQKEEKEYSAFICLYVMIACDEYTPVYNDYVPYSEEYDGYSAFILIPVSITYDNGNRNEHLFLKKSISDKRLLIHYVAKNIMDEMMLVKYKC